jgi:polyhydroxyalkanoate synthesis regulator phasin
MHASDKEQTMDSRIKQRLAIGLGAVLVLGGAGAALAATQRNSPREESQAIIDDAAKQLGVQPADLTNALKKALENRVDAAVADGRLTEAQADRIKEHIQSGDLPLFFGAPHRGGLVPGFGPALHHGLDAAASYLGLTEEQVRTELESGKTLAQVAEAHGKSVDGLVDALVTDFKTKLDAAVKAGRVTQEKANQILQDVRQRVTAHVNGELRERFRRGGPSIFAPPPVGAPA